MRYLVCSVKTKKRVEEIESGWSDPFRMQLGTAVVYDYTEHTYKFYDENDRKKLISKLAGNIVISFNGIRFANLVLVENFNSQWKNIDLFDLIVKSKFGLPLEQAVEKFGSDKVYDGSLSLNSVSFSTLGLNKGECSRPQLFCQSNIKQILQCNLVDARLTRFLFEFARKYRYVIDGSLNRLPLKIKR